MRSFLDRGPREPDPEIVRQLFIVNSDRVDITCLNSGHGIWSGEESGACVPRTDRGRRLLSIKFVDFCSQCEEEALE